MRQNKLVKVLLVLCEPMAHLVVGIDWLLLELESCEIHALREEERPSLLAPTDT